MGNICRPHDAVETIHQTPTGQFVRTTQYHDRVKYPAQNQGPMYLAPGQQQLY